MKRYYSIIVVLLFISCHKMSAQYDAQITNYWAAPNYYNPAYAGQTNSLEAMLLNRMQWVGIKNAPKTMMLSGVMPVKFFDRVHGVGIVTISESAGLFNHSIIGGQYSYRKNMWKGLFSVGIQVGYLNDSFDGTKVNLSGNDPDESGGSSGGGDTGDDAIPTAKVEGSSLDFNLGVYFSRDKWYAGFSVTHLLAPKVTLGDDYMKELPRGYYLMGGYNIQLNNPLLELCPTLMVRSNVMMTTGDISLRMIYNKTFFGGLSWRYGYAEVGNSESVILMLGGKFKNFQLGYAYDFPTSALRIGTMGSHEIFVKYIVDLNLGKGSKNKHKSVRIL